MPLLARARSLLRNLFRRSHVEQALDAEVQGYLDLLADEKIAAGLAPDAARRAARIELGGIEQVKEEVRRVRAGAILEAFAQDLRYAGRTLRRAPGFTAAAVVTLALGIGANTAIFSIVDALLFRPLPIADAGRVFALYRGATGSSGAFSYPEFLDYAAESGHFEGMAAWGGSNRLWLRHGGDLVRVNAQMVSGSYFATLGLRPAAGRLFVDADDDFSRFHPVAVLSERFWRVTLGGDPAAIGRTIVLGGHAFTVAGVAPAAFKGLAAHEVPDVWLPFAAVTLLEPGWNIRDRQEIWISIVARVRRDVDVRQAQASLQPIAIGPGPAPAGTGPAVRLLPASAAVSDPAARASSLRIASLLMGIVGVVLLIACANVANLVLARSAARARELGVRLAIGATRGRIVRQVLTENVVLAAAGGAAGLAVANWTASLLVALAPETAIPPGLDLSPDARVIAFAATLSLATGVAFGVAPAWQLAGADLLAVTKAGERTPGSAGGRAMSVRRVMLVAQVALSLVLLIGASLFIRTLAAAGAVRSGYDPARVLLVTLDFAAAGRDPAASLDTARRVVERVSDLPGIESVSLGQIVPFSGSFIQRPAVREGAPATNDDAVPYSVVGARYFQTLGMTLRGRDFLDTDDEGAARVVAINEALAQKLWPGEDPLGKRLQLPLRNPGPPYEVVAVVSNGKYVTPTEAQHPFFYLPLAQNFRPRLTLHARTTGSPSLLAAEVRHAVRDAAPDLPAYNATTLDDLRAGSLSRERLIARLLTAFGGLALIIAAVGIYGTLAYAVARRTPEMGVRLALGARPADLLWMVARQSAALVALGAAFGLAGALLVSRLVKTFLFGVTPTDPLAFGSAVLILSTVALVATWLPARRAARVDPLTAIRAD